jgi:hypothetical protein
MAVATSPQRIGQAQPAEQSCIPALVQLAWLAAGSAIGFFVPFVFTSALDLHHDLYYGVYFASVLVFLAAYVRATRLDVVAFFQRSWRWSLALGVPTAAFVVANALSRDSTLGPEGLYAGFETAWRGAVYGAVDALLLTAFPGAVALALLGGRLTGGGRRIAFAALALTLSLLITGAYHLGYEQYREEGIAQPETGNSIMSVPLLATGNPLGSILAHASMHVAADIHSYETDVFLPPQTDAP